MRSAPWQYGHDSIINIVIFFILVTLRNKLSNLQQKAAFFTCENYHHFIPSYHHIWIVTLYGIFAGESMIQEKYAWRDFLIFNKMRRSGQHIADKSCKQTIIDLVFVHVV